MCDLFTSTDLKTEISLYNKHYVGSNLIMHAVFCELMQMVDCNPVTDGHSVEDVKI